MCGHKDVVVETSASYSFSAGIWRSFNNNLRGGLWCIHSDKIIYIRVEDTPVAGIILEYSEYPQNSILSSFSLSKPGIDHQECRPGPG